MKNIISRFNYISVQYQRIQKLQYNFCLSNQDVRQNINKLIELNEQQLNSINQIEKESLSLQIATIENELESYLQQFQQNQKQPYYLFRKNLVQLAFYTYYNSKFDLCSKYIGYATLGDYENTYTGELMKQLFLAELSGIQFRINYNNQELQLAEKSLSHWNNILENHSKFYNELKNKHTFDILEFFENMENVHFHQYIETLIVVGQLQYNKGLFNDSIFKFDQAKLLIQSILQFIDSNSEQVQNLSDDIKNYKDFYINQLRKLLSKSYIYRIKIKVLMSELDQAKQLFEEASGLQNTKGQKIQLDIQNFDIQFYSGQPDDVLEQIQTQIQQQISEIKDSIDTKDAFFDYYQFRIKYNLDMNDSSIQIEYLQKLNIHIQKIIELNHHSIQQLIYYENYKEALIIAKQQIKIFENYQLTKHYIYQFSLSQIFFLLTKLQYVNEFQEQINLLESDYYQNQQSKDIPKLFEFYRFQLELFLLKEDHKNKKVNDLVDKMQNIKFEINILEYQKDQILENYYHLFQMKDKLNESLNQQLKYLQLNESFNKDQIDQVKWKIENLSC